MTDEELAAKIEAESRIEYRIDHAMDHMEWVQIHVHHAVNELEPADRIVSPADYVRIMRQSSTLRDCCRDILSMLERIEYLAVIEGEETKEDGTGYYPVPLQDADHIAQ